MKKNWILEELTSRNIAITSNREKLCNALHTQKGVFSAQELREKFKDMDKTTIYRNLELLESADIIHQVGVMDGHQLYEVHQKTKHHHHIMCKVCKKNACVPCSDTQKKQIQGFSDIHHVTFFTGLCSTCAK